MYIETKRMILRDFSMDDVAELQEIFGDSLTMENVEPPYDQKKTRDFLETFCISKKSAFAAVHKGSGKLIGYILFKPYGEPDVYEIGWIFHNNYWRQGYAYEVCSALMEHAFCQMGIHKIFAEAIDGIKSVGLMKKLGMELEGIQRKQTRDHQGQWADLYFYGILQDDYCNKSAQ